MAVREWTTAEPVTLTSSGRVAGARQLHRYGIRHLPVIEEDHPLVRVLTSTDVLLSSLSRQSVAGTA